MKKLLFIPLVFAIIIYTFGTEFTMNFSHGTDGMLWTDSSAYIINNSDIINTIYGNLEASLELKTYFPYKIQSTNRFSKIWKRSIKYNGENFNVTAGNFYVSKARNTGLSFYYDDQLHIDRYLDGISASFSPNMLHMNFLAATPYSKEYKDGVYITHNDTTDFLLSLGTDLSLNKRFDLGMNFDYLNIVSFGRSDKLTNIYIDLPFDIFEIYSSFGYRSGFDRSSFANNSGFSSYTNFLLYLSSTSIGLETFYSDSFDFGGSGFRYAETPTLTYSGYSINRGMDEIGGRLNVQTTFSSNIFKTDLAYITNKNRDKKLSEIYSALTLYPGNNSIDFSLNYIYEDHLHSDIDLKQTFKSDFEFSIASGIPIKLINREEFTSEDTLNYLDSELEGDFTLLPSLTIYGTFTYRSKNIRNEGTMWILGGARFDFMNYNTLQLEVGSRKGGIVCSGGVCRYEDPFKGIKLKYTFSI